MWNSSAEVDRAEGGFASLATHELSFISNLISH